MKLSKTAQQKIDALVRAVKDPSADIKYFKSTLEKYVTALEKAITSHEAAGVHHARMTIKRQRALRSQLKEQDSHITALTKRSKS